MRNGNRGNLRDHIFDRAPDLSAVRNDVAKFQRGRFIECEDVCVRQVCAEGTIVTKQRFPAAALRKISESPDDFRYLNSGNAALGDRPYFKSATNRGIGRRSHELRNNVRVTADHFSPRDFMGSKLASRSGSLGFSPSHERLKIRTIISPALSSRFTVSSGMRRTSSAIDTTA